MRVQDWSVETLLSFQIPEEIAITPDATLAVYTLRTLDEEEGKYRYKLWSVSRGNSPVQLTRGDSKDTYPQISPDGKWLGFISDRCAKPSDEEEHAPDQQLYVLPLGGGEAFLASEDLGNIYDYTFSPDGSCVYVIADEAENAYEKYQRTTAEEDLRDVIHEERNQHPRRICSISLHDLQVKTLYRRDFGLMQLAVSPDGGFLLFVTNYSGLANDLDRCDLWRLDGLGTDVEGCAASPVVVRSGACVQPAISPSGQMTAFVAPRGDRSEHAQSDLWLVDNASGVVTNLTEQLSFVGDVQDVQWLREDALVAAVEKGLYAPLVRFQKTGQSDAGWTYEFLTEETAVVGEFAVAARTDSIGYLAETVDHPYEIYMLSGALQSDAPTQDVWTELHAEFAGLPRARVQPFQWKSFDGWDMEGVLSLPNDELVGPGPYPLIVDIHGGPAWHATMAFSNYLNLHWLGSLGYAVFCPNYRGGVGYGHEYIRANAMDLGGGDYRDIMSGVDAVVATGLVDEARMGLTGGSYGGYMTNWIIGHDHRFQAAVSEFGIWSLFTDFGCSTQRVWEVMYLGRYWENESLYLERSPARYVHQIDTPVLVIHGDDDDNTFPANSKEMYNALLEAGKTVEYFHYPREGHGIREPRHRADELRRIAHWFGHYIKTSRTVLPVALGEERLIGDGRYKASVQKVEATTRYRAHGEDYGRVIEVYVSFTPVSSASDTRVLVLKMDNPATSEVSILFSGKSPHQRPSLFGSAKLLPLGAAAGNVVVTGDTVLHLEHVASVQFLFDADVLNYGTLNECLLFLTGVPFQLG
ncbi:S9 family peptidase [Alicyclobacillus fastidiosus]|uniref:S9 family peptidase n=1 Tax=Alicyclobacillus fastidiosus TaxID=392011 RepID=A0ABY6ZPC9_9BACL|nr:S9 family peptidase [Alicyclobacillus fastidiosus]WAH44694.1 S9 family peptidase [Alicyclobacillus fastidiosus]